ncbi:Serine/threonine protein kinase [Chondrus crispus]|uniref:Serine/threonine protein kinase n=1 Tax=Chondrus crispus TaxID=2769 RepID=R7Q4A5_CHOCR|nr:Serine/threonine protein kinase [Chondrus crispus]CDF32305.1 Serine/threonine protein kinase [Chondrus crispus]|eukprot:XP_005711970.1 Serine/threonine protein kinase [Chondrus crispus]
MSTTISRPGKTAATSIPSGSISKDYPWHPSLEAVYEPGVKLGRGCFATVYKAKRRSDAVQVAIKAVEKNKLDGDTTALLRNELEVLQAVSKHPGIVTLLDSLDTEEHMFFIMEYVDGGPLLDRIVSRGSFSENDARVLLRATLLTLEFLANLGCVHRDIKPENILVDNCSDKWPVKLTDFGFSEKMQPDELLYQTMGTPLFVAPEILNGRGYDCACDMWSLGVVLYLVLCGYPPFPSDSPNVLVEAIVNGNYSFPAPEWDHVSDDAKDALRRMLEIDPHRRITPTEALVHPWFRAAQSTSDLPNSKLKEFNVARKFKALYVAVRTTQSFWKVLDPNRKREQDPVSHEKLQEDVERNRAMLERLKLNTTKMTVPETSSAPGSSKPNAASQFPFTPLRHSRRSLVLPVSALDSTSERSHGGGGHQVKQSTGFKSWNSQMMSSRAEELVAQANGSLAEKDNLNPFFLDNSVSTENPVSSGRKRLAKLDFNGLL